MHCVCMCMCDKERKKQETRETISRDSSVSIINTIIYTYTINTINTHTYTHIVGMQESTQACVVVVFQDLPEPKKSSGSRSQCQRSSYKL